MKGETSAVLSRRALFGGGKGELMPWADAKSIFEYCTGCGACSKACPEGIVMTGRGGHPYVEFSSACTFCGDCAEACTEGVFDLTKERPWNATAKIGSGCFEPMGISCRACEDACPETALKACPQLGGVVRMVVKADACTGCGACVPVCPNDAVEIVAHG